jgi:hypothetical protein
MEIVGVGVGWGWGWGGVVGYVHKRAAAVDDDDADHGDDHALHVDVPL